MLLVCYGLMSAVEPIDQRPGLSTPAASASHRQSSDVLPRLGAGRKFASAGLQSATFPASSIRRSADSLNSRENRRRSLCLAYFVTPDSLAIDSRQMGRRSRV